MLASLPQHELRTGLDALRSHAVAEDSRSICEPIDLFVFR